ncbi:MAG: hypothetical protein D6781_11960 [Verrucomicrobia bacterium]|nr:MAG: hypothetical protein D6781_11960 [Verrucomicrobiota bacterium]
MARIVTRADGTSNTAALAGTSSEPADRSSRGVIVEHLLAKALTLEIVDGTVGDPPFTLTLADIRIDAERLAYLPGTTAALPQPGTLRLEAHLSQPHARPALLFAAARFGAFGGDRPVLRLSGRATGLLFATFIPVIPEDTGMLLGGDGIDASIEARLADGRIDLKAQAITSRRSDYHIEVTGPIDQPRLAIPKKLEAIASRMTGGASRVVGSLVHGGGEVIAGTARTISTIGRGAADTAMGLLKGAGRSAKGILTLDTKETAEGLKNMTVDTAGDIGDTLSESTRDIGETGKSAVGQLANDPRLQKWLEASPDRHRAATAGLFDQILAEPFPPRLDAADHTPATAPP